MLHRAVAIAACLTIASAVTHASSMDEAKALRSEGLKILEDARAPGAMVTVNCTWWPKNPEISGTAHEAYTALLESCTAVGSLLLGIEVMQDAAEGDPNSDLN